MPLVSTNRMILLLPWWLLLAACIPRSRETGDARPVFDAELAASCVGIAVPIQPTFGGWIKSVVQRRLGWKDLSIVYILKGNCPRLLQHALSPDGESTRYPAYLALIGGVGSQRFVRLWPLPLTAEIARETQLRVPYREGLARLVLSEGLSRPKSFPIRLLYDAYHYCGPHCTMTILQDLLQHPNSSVRSHACIEMHRLFFAGRECLNSLLKKGDFSGVSEPIARECLQACDRLDNVLGAGDLAKFQEIYFSFGVTDPQFRKELLEIGTERGSPVVRNLACRSLKESFGSAPAVCGKGP